MTHSCTVLIAAPDVLPGMQERAAAEGSGELIVFADADALRALEVITARRPELVVLERVFAGTPRGAALVNRIRADPSLIDSEVLIVSADADFKRAGPRVPGGTAGGTATAVASAPAGVSAQPLDMRGTRRAARHRIEGSVDVLVDGNSAALVDLSTIGAQVVSPSVLKPNQRIRMVLTDDQGSVRFNALVAWAAFEIPPRSGPRYRAGLEFLDANATAVDAYCSRHKA